MSSSVVSRPGIQPREEGEEHVERVVLVQARPVVGAVAPGFTRLTPVVRSLRPRRPGSSCSCPHHAAGPGFES